MTKEEYVQKCDPWPLNPDGELFLGLKIEDRYCVDNVDEIAAVPGIAFAEWGPGDMGMSYGHPDAHDPPYPKIMDQAREKIKSALKNNGKTPKYGLIYQASLIGQSRSFILGKICRFIT